MANLAKNIGDREGISDYNGLAYYLVQASVDGEDRAFQKLFAQEASLMKDQRIENLKKELARSREQYIMQLLDSFKEISEGDMAEIILCGGTASYLGEELETQLTNEFPWVTVNWHADLTIPEDLIPEGDPFGRFSDVYGEYLYQVNQTRQLAQY